MGITVTVRRISSLQLTVAVGLRSDSGVVTGNDQGSWVLTELAHQNRPLPDVTTILLRSTGTLQSAGESQDTEIRLSAQGASVGTDLDHAFRLDVMAGENLQGVVRSARLPSLILGLPTTLPASQNIRVADPATLEGVRTRIAGATGALAGTGPHLTLVQESTFLELLGAEKISSSKLTLTSPQRLHVFATTVKPMAAASHVELRHLSRGIVINDTPQLTGSAASRRLDGNFLRIDSEEVTESATLRVPTDTVALRPPSGPWTISGCACAATRRC